jgi:uncharacterized protein YuzE
MQIEIDTEANAVYAEYLDAPVARTVEIDDLRVVDYTAEGQVKGIELLAVSNGVTLDGLPGVDLHALAERLTAEGIAVRAMVSVSGDVRLDEQRSTAHSPSIERLEWTMRHSGTLSQSSDTEGLNDSRNFDVQFELATA